MKRQELKDQIEGSILKKQYLEAFLVQSAYIEGLVKLYANYQYFNKIVDTRKEEEMVRAIWRKIDSYSLYNLIEFLYESELIIEKDKGTLNKYREERNKTLHDLLSQMGGEKFEDELKEACEEGREIIKSEKFKEMEALVDFVEKRREEERLEEANKKLQSVEEIPEAELPKTEPEEKLKESQP